jgi:hypothetical protein
MDSVKADFRTRAREVKRYFAFVTAAAQDHVHLAVNKTTDRAMRKRESDELLKTLKASCYLLLYNLVESTMRNVVQAIFDNFRSRGVRFDDCRQEIKRLVLVNFRARSTDGLLPKLLDIARHVITETFEAKEVFSGNLDARAIRETAKKFGFVPPSARSGWAMVTVKNNRNDLAHGNKSFSEIGQDTTTEQLHKAQSQTRAVLNATIRNVSKYLHEERYLASNSGVLSA